MDSKYVVIAPDGEKEPVACDKVSLELAQSLVDGFVEIVPGFNRYLGQPCVALCDEDGKMKRKGHNNRATVEWYKCVGAVHDSLVGNVLIITGPARKAWG